MKAIDTAYVSNPKSPTRRIKATCEGGSLALHYDPKLSAKKNHQRAAARLKKKMGWDGELHHAVVLPPGEHFWVVIPEWMIAFDRFCTANDLHMDEVLSVITKPHRTPKTRQFRAA